MYDDGTPRSFTLAAIAVGIFAALILLRMLLLSARSSRRRYRNNRLPVITVPAVVVTRRGYVSGGGDDSSASTSYFVTFELRGGERLELALAGQQFGLLVEQDRGELSYQGTRFEGFVRTPQDR